MCDLPALFVAHERAFRDMSQYIMRYIIFLCRPTTPQTAYAASSTKARLRMPQALLRCPCTGEPIWSECRPTTPQILPQSASLTAPSPMEPI